MPRCRYWHELPGWKHFLWILTQFSLLKILLKEDKTTILLNGPPISIAPSPGSSTPMLATPKRHAKHSLKANWVFQISETSVYNVLSLQLGKLASKKNAKSFQEAVHPASDKQDKGGPGQVSCTVYIIQQGY